MSKRSRMTAAQAETLLRCYSERRTPAEAADVCGLSRNTVYLRYSQIRWRLILTGYYSDAAMTADDPGLPPAVKRQLRERRGVRKDKVYPHSAKLIHWLDELPPRLVRKHIHKIIELTGPIDQEPELDAVQAERVRAYVRYAQAELIWDRRRSAPVQDEAQRALVERGKSARDRAWRAYRTASKRVQRAG